MIPALAIHEISNTSQSSSSTNGLNFLPTQDRQAAILEFQQRLVLLHHASKCEELKCRVSPFCKDMRALWEHANSCNAQSCQYPHCISTRFLLAHYYKCEDAECAICKPLKDSIKRIAKRQRSIVRFPARKVENYDSDDSPLPSPRDAPMISPRDAPLPPPSPRDIPISSPRGYALVSPREVQVPSAREINNVSPSSLSSANEDVVVAKYRKSALENQRIAAEEHLLNTQSIDSLTSALDTFSEGFAVETPGVAIPVGHNAGVAQPWSLGSSDGRPAIPTLNLDFTISLQPLETIPEHSNNADIQTRERVDSLCSALESFADESSEPTQPVYYCGGCSCCITSGYRYHCANCNVDFCVSCFHCEGGGEPHEHPVRAFQV